MNPVDTLCAYHERTKHRLGTYARGPEYLDWDNQPDPFRRFHGAPLQPLPLLPDPTHAPASMQLAAVSKLLELSMGLSAWKAFGPDRWALRCNPSSGNLHPTEAYLVTRGLPGLADGVHHYAPREHALELRAGLTAPAGPPLCLLGLSSIAWREAWKYGERAYRYVQLDVGHALGAVRYAAAVLGWRVRLLPLDDNAIAHMLGLDREADFSDAETEHPDLLLQLHPSPDTPPMLSGLPETCNWQGRANALGGEPYLQWPVLQQALAAAECLMAPDIASHAETAPMAPAADTLARLIRARRSAQSYIGRQSTLGLDGFTRLLHATLPQAEKLPWDAWPLPPRLHLVLFVHRVDGLEPGLYALPRHTDGLALMQSAMGPGLEWLSLQDRVPGLPLYRLLAGDMRKVARGLACHQEIASAGSFTLAMLAEFDDAMQHAACAYRHLHWEAGLLGQVLYLEAEAVGMRGTGIGCFFDDSVHLSLGIQEHDRRLQVLYHFTVGSPRHDPRLQTLPPYQHLGDRPET